MRTCFRRPLVPSMLRSLRILFSSTMVLRLSSARFTSRSLEAIAIPCFSLIPGGAHFAARGAGGGLEEPSHRHTRCGEATRPQAASSRVTRFLSGSWGWSWAWVRWAVAALMRIQVRPLDDPYFSYSGYREANGRDES